MSSDPNTGTGRTVEECEHMIQKSLKTPMVRFLREKLGKAGCHVGDDFFHAVNCKGAKGFYLPGNGVNVCSNQMKFQDDVNQVVIHELIHAYDDCRAADMARHDCAHQACTEIRAGHLSGDCHFKRELLRTGVHKLRGHGSDCVKRRAIQSVMANPLCSEIAAKDAVDAVWDICYNDTTPFDRAP